MNWQLLLPLIVTTVIAIGGWYAAHAFAVRRDQANRRREFRVENLISAYRKLANCAQRSDQQELYDRASDLESAMADIQLFGTPAQIESARRFVDDIVTNKSARIDTLLNLLRADLRLELKLSPISKDITWIRVTPPERLG
jgi:hypothetical protein